MLELGLDDGLVAGLLIGCVCVVIREIGEMAGRADASGRKPNLADVARGLATAAAGGGLIVLGLLRPETWFASYAGGPLAIIGIFMTLKALFRL